MHEHYDVIIIGTGAGGGTLAHRLAPSGKRILLLERGGYLPREPENWDSREMFQKDRYLSDELWYDKDGAAYKPHQQYFVGGNTKFYGAILFRLRERDFGEVSTTAASRRRGRSPTRISSPTTPRPSGSTWFTGSRARIRPSRGAQGRFRIRRSRTSRASSSWPTTSSAPAIARSICRSASTWTSPTPRRAAACAATGSTASPAWPTERPTRTCAACGPR